MLRTIQHHFLRPARRLRWHSQLSAAASTAPTPPAARQLGKNVTASKRDPYFVPRNTRGSIPVYSDLRNSNKYLTLIRNIEGNTDALAKDLTATLVTPGSPEAERLKITTVRGRHLVLSGGNWKRQVLQWLQAKGF